MSEESLNFSASRLKLIDDCFGKYHFKYIKKIPVDQIIWPGTIRGSVLHRILEESVLMKLDKIDNETILQSVKGKFTLYFEEMKADKTKGKFTKSRTYKPDEYNEQGEKAAIIFTRFVINYFHDIKNAFPELKIEAKYEFEDNVNINGIIDLPVLTWEDKLRIIDFKTTSDSNKWYFVLFKEDIQKLMYFYLGWKHFQKFSEGFDYLVYNIDEKNIFFQSINYVEEVADYKTFFEPLTQRIRTLKFLHNNADEKYYNPNKESCKWCDFKHICPKAIK